VRDRTAFQNRSKNLTIALLKRQGRQRREQIDRHIEALNAEITSLIAPGNPPKSLSPPPCENSPSPQTP